MPEIDHRLVQALREPIAPIAPPAPLQARILAALADTDDRPTPMPVRHLRAPRRKRFVLVLAAAAAVVATVGIADGVFRSGGPAGTLEVETVLIAKTGTAEAAVAVRKTGIGRVVELSSESLPILPKGEYYELWFVGPGDSPARPNRISAGTFHPDANGKSRVVFAAAVDPALFPVLSVTPEPGDGDPAPSGTEVLRTPRP